MSADVHQNIPRLPSSRLDGRHAIVTGASRGIGRAAAHALAQAGASVTVMARSRDDLKRVAAEIAGLGGVAEVFVGDVRNPDHVRAAVAGAAAGRPLSICVNSAGVNRPCRSEDLSLEDWDLVIDTNVKGTFLMCQEVGRILLRQGTGGRIVNVSSMLGAVGYRDRAVYCASKHAVNGLTKALAIDWAEAGITVNAVAPSFTQTPLTRVTLADPEVRHAVLERVPLNRIGEVEDLMGAVVYLASDAASFVTGHILTVDGGWLAW